MVAHKSNDCPVFACLGAVVMGSHPCDRLNITDADMEKVFHTESQQKF